MHPKLRDLLEGQPPVAPRTASQEEISHMMTVDHSAEAELNGPISVESDTDKSPMQVGNRRGPLGQREKSMMQ